MTIPLPFTTALLAGLFTLSGVWIASLLTTSREHHRWVSDNKKQEWRELIDQMHQSLSRMQYGFITAPRAYEAGDDSFDPNAGMTSGRRILRNRIFIAAALQQHGIEEHWEELVRYSIEASHYKASSQQEEPTLATFNKRVSIFEKKLLEAARADDGVIARHRWFRRSTLS